MNEVQKNEEVKGTVKEIRAKIRLSMNGVVAQSMREKGVKYASNLGVDIPRLKEIATYFTPDIELAKELWKTKGRETMILATMLMPINKFSRNEAAQWIEDISTMEIAEISSMYLFSKLPYAADLALENIRSGSLFKQITGFLIFTRIHNKLNIENIKKINNCAINILPTDSLHLYNSIAICLSKLCRNNKEISDIIYNGILHHKNAEEASCKYVLDKIKQEIEFLEF